MKRSFSVTVLAGALGLAALPGCGGGDGGDPSVADALQDEGGMVVRYRPVAGGTDPAKLRDAAGLIEERARRVKLHLSATVEGDDVVVRCVRCRDRAQVDEVTTPGVLAFYDWEVTVLGPDGKPDPTNQSVTGGASAGNPGAGTLTRYDAVRRAAKRPAQHEADDTTHGTFYGVRDSPRIVQCGPLPTRRAAEAACGSAPVRILRVPRGTIVVRSQAEDQDPRIKELAADAYYVLEDDPSLLGARDIRDPEQDTDDGSGGSGQPSVIFRFAADGQQRFEAVTRTIARRGADQLLPGQEPAAVANHFAIVLDGRLLTVPYVDPRENPNGIDGSNGSQISGSFTRASARRLAALLETGPLPVALTVASERRIAPTG